MRIPNHSVIYHLYTSVTLKKDDPWGPDASYSTRSYIYRLFLNFGKLGYDLIRRYSFDGTSTDEVYYYRKPYYNYLLILFLD